jgi:hypothetical protein
MESRLDSAVNLLKQCRSQGKTYHDATQALAQQGYSQQEIEQASYRFPYNLGDSQAEDSPPPKSNLTEDDVHEIELDESKQQLNRDYWYQFIPIVGAYYKTKRVNDYAKYESLKTGHGHTAVLVIWFIAMAVGTFVALVAAPWFVGLFTMSNTALYLSHYIGVIVAVLLLHITFRTIKR